MLARHAKSKELGDFGGGIRQSETGLQGGYREWMEESRNIFAAEYPSEEYLKGNPALLNEGMAVVFVQVSSEWYETASELFLRSGTGKKCSDEVSEVVWVDERTFTRMIYSYSRSASGRSSDVLWKKVQIFFRKCLAPRSIACISRVVSAPGIMIGA